MKIKKIHPAYQYLFSAGNLTGCLLGLLGLGLHLFGIVDRYWFLTTLVLYGIGTMVIPPVKNFKLH